MSAAQEKRTAPGMDPEGTAEVFRTMGVSEEQVERYLASRRAMVEVDPEPFAVWPGNERALEVFLVLAGSWRCRGMQGVPIGLDEGAIHARMQVMGAPHDVELFDDVVAMGRAAADEIIDRYYDH